MMKFGTIVADPPWSFSNKATRAAADNHYPTMSSEDIAGVMSEWSKAFADNAHLYLWCPSALLNTGLEIMEGLGFDYKFPLVWVKAKRVGTLGTTKLQIGLGNYYRHAHELCLFGVKGKAPARVRNLPTVFFAPRGKHSAKPDILQDWAEKLSPGPRLELFARRARSNWATWGNEVSPNPERDMREFLARYEAA